MPIANTPAVEQDIYCPRCGYNLRGLSGTVCPECGDAFDRSRLSATRLPWTQRRQIGAWPAYWRTVALSSFRSKQFMEEIGDAIHVRDAKAFWIITMLYASATIFAAVAILTWMAWPLIVPVWMIGFGMIGVVLFLLAATGAPSYLCHPRRLIVSQQNRAIAMSYYACAIWAWLPGLMLFLVPLIWAERMSWEWLAATILTAMSAAVTFTCGWYFDTIRVVRRATSRGWRGAVFVAVVLPVMWAVLAVLLVVVLPMLLCFLWLFLLGGIGLM